MIKGVSEFWRQAGGRHNGQTQWRQGLAATVVRHQLIMGWCTVDQGGLMTDGGLQDANPKRVLGQNNGRTEGEVSHNRDGKVVGHRQ